MQYRAAEPPPPSAASRYFIILPYLGGRIDMRGALLLLLVALCAFMVKVVQQRQAAEAAAEEARLRRLAAVEARSDLFFQVLWLTLGVVVLLGCLMLRQLWLSLRATPPECPPPMLPVELAVSATPAPAGAAQAKEATAKQQPVKAGSPAVVPKGAPPRAVLAENIETTARPSPPMPPRTAQPPSAPSPQPATAAAPSVATAVSAVTERAAPLSQQRSVEEVEEEALDRLSSPKSSSRASKKQIGKKVGYRALFNTWTKDSSDDVVVDGAAGPAAASSPSQELEDRPEVRSVL
jgi:hypothetical protein